MIDFILKYRTYLVPFVSLIALAAIGISCTATDGPVSLNQNWLLDEKWDAGLAEVALYTGKQTKYGTPRHTNLELITVREHFDPIKRVKMAPTAETLPIMKCNLTRRTRTGVYEYLQMASVFLHRETADLIKASAVSAEWCGNSHVLVETSADAAPDAGAAVHISNYFDGGGTSTTTLEPGVVLYDALILHLRQELHRLSAGETLRVARTLMSNKPKIEIDEVTITSVEGGMVVLDFPDRSETFTFDAAKHLHPLKSWRSSTGDYLKLRKRSFMDYWNKTGVGDERLLR